MVAIIILILFAAFIYGGVRLWLHIYRSGLRRIARMNAEEADKLTRQRAAETDRGGWESHP